MTAVVTAVDIQPVPKLWPASTVVVLASGPSLTREDVESCRGRARLIAVKDAIRLAPFADCLYGYDAKFWRWHDGFPAFTGLKYSMDPDAARHGVQLLRNTGTEGLELDPCGLRTGMNSTYQAVNLAVHLGARRIVLLGADMGHSPHGSKYFFGNRDWPQQVQSPFGGFIATFLTIVDPLRAIGVEVLNASRSTTLTAFPRVSLEEALA